MPSRKGNSIVSSASSEALPITEDSFVIGLTSTATNAVQFSLSEIPPATTADPVEDPTKVPFMTRIYKGLIGEKSLFSSTVTTQETVVVVAEQKSAELEICLREVGRHDSLSDCWVVIYDRVYDITKFVYEHPGGYDVLMENAGRDATFAFRGSGHSADAVQMMKKYAIGILPMEERMYRTEASNFRWGEMPE